MRTIDFAVVAIAAVSWVSTWAEQHDGISLSIARALARDPACQLAFEELRSALSVRGVRTSDVVSVTSREGAMFAMLADGPRPPAKRPTGDALTSGEAFVITSPRKRSLLVQGGSALGVAYGLHHVAERIRLGEDVWQVRAREAPFFGERLFSEEGQLLDLPDRGYYSDDPPYLNVDVLNSEVARLKALLPHLLRHRFNGLTILHLNVEDYIDYDLLDRPIYAQDDPHRARSKALCQLMKDFVEHAHSLHLRVYLQVYELAYPPAVGRHYQLTDASEDAAKVIDAKYRELFSRVPIDGMVITATEQHPRCGYRAKRLWSSTEGLARMACFYHRAIVQNCGKRLVFRLWRTGQTPKAFETVAANTPDDLTLCIKNTSGDYYLKVGANALLRTGAPSKKPFMVLFDAFREFDGWSRLICYPTLWKERFELCAKTGVNAVNCWGPWSPGCIWPDEERGYLVGPDTPKSWRGLWADYRIFLNGFTPGQANVYLFSRLAWAPKTPVDQITRDWAKLHFGPTNVAVVAQALDLSQKIWMETFLRRTHPCHVKWTMIFSPRNERADDALKHNTFDAILQSNQRSIEGSQRMLQLIQSIDPATCPNPAAGEGLRTAAEKTALFFETYMTAREGWLRRGRLKVLKGEARAAELKALTDVCTRLRSLLPKWQEYPQEAVDWRILEDDGKLRTAPYWMGHASVKQFVAEIAACQ